MYNSHYREVQSLNTTFIGSGTPIFVFPLHNNYCVPIIWRFIFPLHIFIVSTIHNIYLINFGDTVWLVIPQYKIKRSLYYCEPCSSCVHGQDNNGYLIVTEWIKASIFVRIL